MGSSGMIFGISRLFLGYKKEPKRGNGGSFRAFNGFFVSQLSDHVNHPFKDTLHKTYGVQNVGPVNISDAGYEVFEWALT